MQFLMPSKASSMCPLDDKSKLLTAMLTPLGVFIYNVLAMGLSNANDIFEQCLQDILHDLPGVLNIADDILVFGETYEEFKDNVLPDSLIIV